MHNGDRKPDSGSLPGMPEVEVLAEPLSRRPGRLMQRSEWPYFPVILSAGVFPGVGQWMQEHRGRALLFGLGSVGAMAAAGYLVIARLTTLMFQGALVVTSPVDVMVAMWGEAHVALPAVDIMGVLWGVGVLDAWLVARRSAARMKAVPPLDADD